ncbi:hypothetical protein Bbelb_350610 [Branchiostoma belcheri]|nr:hypothetical protein Bbelb_350610 [Branchiostoma belcheri]
MEESTGVVQRELGHRQGHGDGGQRALEYIRVYMEALVNPTLYIRELRQLIQDHLALQRGLAEERLILKVAARIPIERFTTVNIQRRRAFVTWCRHVNPEQGSIIPVKSGQLWQQWVQGWDGLVNVLPIQGNFNREVCNNCFHLYKATFMRRNTYLVTGNAKEPPRLLPSLKPQLPRLRDSSSEWGMAKSLAAPAAQQKGTMSVELAIIFHVGISILVTERLNRRLILSNLLLDVQLYTFTSIKTFYRIMLLQAELKDEYHRRPATTQATPSAKYSKTATLYNKFGNLPELFKFPGRKDQAGPSRGEEGHEHQNNLFCYGDIITSHYLLPNPQTLQTVPDHSHQICNIRDCRRTSAPPCTRTTCSAMVTSSHHTTFSQTHKLFRLYLTIPIKSATFETADNNLFCYGDIFTSRYLLPNAQTPGTFDKRRQMKRRRYLNHLAPTPTGAAEEHKKRTTFLAVRATGDSSKVYVIIQRQPIAECPRVLEARGVQARNSSSSDSSSSDSSSSESITDVNDSDADDVYKTSDGNLDKAMLILDTLDDLHNLLLRTAIVVNDLHAAVDNFAGERQGNHNAADLAGGPHPHHNPGGVVWEHPHHNPADNLNAADLAGGPHPHYNPAEPMGEYEQQVGYPQYEDDGPVVDDNQSEGSVVELYITPPPTPPHSASTGDLRSIHGRFTHPRDGLSHRSRGDNATRHLRATYSIQHRYEGPPSEMLNMLELYRRAMLIRTTILKTHLDGPFGQGLMYMRNVRHTVTSLDKTILTKTTYRLESGLDLYVSPTTKAGLLEFFSGSSDVASSLSSTSKDGGKEVAKAPSADLTAGGTPSVLSGPEKAPSVPSALSSISTPTQSVQDSTGAICFCVAGKSAQTINVHLLRHLAHKSALSRIFVSNDALASVPRFQKAFNQGLQSTYSLLLQPKQEALADYIDSLILTFIRDQDEEYVKQAKKAYSPAVSRVTRAAKDAKHKRYKRFKHVKSFFLGRASVPGVGQTIRKMVMTKEEKQFAEEAEKAAAAFHGHGRGGYGPPAPSLSWLGTSSSLVYLAGQNIFQGLGVIRGKLVNWEDLAVLRFFDRIDAPLINIDEVSDPDVKGPFALELKSLVVEVTESNTCIVAPISAISRKRKSIILHGHSGDEMAEHLRKLTGEDHDLLLSMTGLDPKSQDTAISVEYVLGTYIDQDATHPVHRWNRVVECPLCKGPPTRVGPNIAVRNLTSNQTVKCELGCTFPDKVSVEEVLQHLKTECPRVDVPCTHAGTQREEMKNMLKTNMKGEKDFGYFTSKPSISIMALEEQAKNPEKYETMLSTIRRKRREFHNIYKDRHMDIKERIKRKLKKRGDGVTGLFT